MEYSFYINNGINLFRKNIPQREHINIALHHLLIQIYNIVRGENVDIALQMINSETE